jgi:hypothetical protein
MDNRPLRRTDIINRLALEIGAQAYLEIGVGRGQNFKRVKCPLKVGVDPSKNTTHKITSDEFFQDNKDYFDLIFIDGLHHAEQVERDILNSLNFLNKGGFIVCHDMIPKSEGHQKVPRVQSAWTGDCWKAWVKLRSQKTNIEMFVVDRDRGCGVIRKGNQETINIDGIELTWGNLCKHKKKWLNLISEKEFLEMKL